MIRIPFSELAESIAKVGLINPITLSRHNDRFILQAGSRRPGSTSLATERIHTVHRYQCGHVYPPVYNVTRKFV